MGQLGVQAVGTLHALNQWISVIDTNITNSRRIGYKETRVSLEDGFVDTIGKTLDKLGVSIQIPSSSLDVAKSQILDYEQGLINTTDAITEFAINGKGYFVVEDVSNGERYATRDGTFHFDNSGYLVDGRGLRVLSAGQDYIRVPSSDKFYVNDAGITLDSTTYGDRQLMVVQLPNSHNLFYSKFGFTTFEMGRTIPIAFDNNFNKTMDGLMPYLADRINPLTGLPITNYQSKFTHIKPNLPLIPAGSVRMDMDTTVSGDANALVSARKFTDFRNSFRFVPTDINTGAGTGFTSLGFSFGQKVQSDSIGDSGFGAGVYMDSAGTFHMEILRGGANPGVLATTILPPVDNLVNNNEYEISLIIYNEQVSLHLRDITNGTNVATITTNGIRQDDYDNTFQSIGTLSQAPSLSAPGTVAAAGPLEGVNITRLHIEESGKKQYYNALMTGGNAEALDSTVIQYALEESTSSLTEQIPILGNVQKVFSALSKVININNSSTDDLNALIR